VRVELLCRLADAQLAEERALLEERVRIRLAEAAAHVLQGTEVMRTHNANYPTSLCFAMGTSMGATV
jgi:hypothetical protein